MAGAAFDLSERLQTPVFVLSDLDLGMNLWISEEFEYPEAPLDRGKVLSAEDVAQFKDEHNGQRWGRYLDVDGDGIPYRTLPGTPNPAAAYFTRGSGHTEYATYTERPEIWERNLKRVEKKFETARTLVPAPIVEDTPGSNVGILSFGTNHYAVVEAQARLEKAGIACGYLRLRALPLTDAVRAFIARHERVYVVENNMDGQLATISARRTA